MRLIDAQQVLRNRGTNPNPAQYRYDPQSWRNLFKQFWRNAPLYEPWSDPVAATNEYFVSFQYRPFGDGGYLDNKPFTYATQSLAKRRADLPVQRKLLYVEPDPEREATQIQDKPGPQTTVPNVVQHSLAALLLPSTETIREDLAALRQRNEFLEHLGMVIQTMQDGLTPFSEDEAKAKVQIDECYKLLRVEETTERLATILAAILGFEQGTPYLRAVRYLVVAWRNHEFASNLISIREEDPHGKAKGFLDYFDADYAVRRHEYVQQRIEALIANPDAMAKCETTQVALRLVKKRLNELYSYGLTVAPDLPMVRREAFLNAAQALEGGGPVAEPQKSDAKQIFQLLCELKINARELGYILNGFDPQSTCSAKDIGDEEPVQKLQSPKLHSKVELAQLVLGYKHFVGSGEDAVRDKRPDLLDELCRRLGTETGLDKLEGSRKEQLASAAKLGIPDSTEANKALEFVRQKYDEFLTVDSRVFPVAYGSGAAESKGVDIVRVSPQEACSLVKDPATRRSKLAGVQLGHFGAFFDADWRRSDIIWGRLDTAEILIKSLLPPGAPSDELIAEAQLAILSDSKAWLAAQANTGISLDPLIKQVQANMSARITQ